MSGASEATDKLQATWTAAYQALRERLAEFRQTIAGTNATDIVAAMAALDEVSLRAKALAEAAKGLHETIDAGLIDAMADTGCMSFTTPFHTTSYREGIDSVDVPDPAAVPAEFMTPRELIPDKRAIGKMLKMPCGNHVNWARLAPGKPGLVRRSHLS